MKTVKFLAILASVFLYIGCGGNGSSPTEAAETVSNKVAIYTNAGAIAYKSADSDTWTAIDTKSGTNVGNGIKKYTIDKLDKYNVALFNSGSSAPLKSLKNAPAYTPKELVLFSYTKDDGDIYYEFHKKTDSREINGTVSYNVPGDTPNTYNIHAYGSRINISSGNYSMRIDKQAVDLVAIALKEVMPAAGTYEPLRFYIDKSISTTTAHTTKNIDFNSSNSCALTKHNIITDPNSEGGVLFISENGTHTHTEVSGSNEWYSAESSCKLLNSKDTYVVAIESEHGFKSVSTPATSTQSDADINASYINELTGVSYQGSGLITGLNSYTPNPNSPNVVAYRVDASSASGETYIAVLSKNYLGSNTTYTLPELTSVAGFDKSIKLADINDGGTVVVMSNKSLKDISGGKKLNIFLDNNYIPYEGTVEYAVQGDITP